MRCNTKKSIYKIALITVLIFIISSLLWGGVGVVNATTSTYTNVLTDLRKDGQFNVSEYPENVKDYSLQVIQIGESTNGELFIYTYQPSGQFADLKATQINMSLSDKLGIELESDEQLSEADRPKLYDLKLVNSSGTLFKYVVKDFKISNAKIRYYNITSIYRKYDKGLGDTGSSAESELSYKAFEVGKLYKVTTENGIVKYDCQQVNVIKIINPFFDYLRYTDGFMFYKTAVDSHYVAFSTDIKIEYLYAAELEYKSYAEELFTWKNGTQAWEFGDTEFHKIVVTDDEEYHKDGKWWLLGSSADYKRIQSVDDFLKNEKDITSSTKNKLERLEWVLRFDETDYSCQKYPDGAKNEKFVRCSEVSILSLMFKYQGKVYNFGAVADIGSEDNIPGNEPEQVGFWAYIWRCIVRLFKGTATLSEQIVAVIALFIVVLALPILLTVLSFVFPAFGAVMKIIFKGLWTAIQYIFIGLWYVITAPVRVIIGLVNKIKGGD